LISQTDNLQKRMEAMKEVNVTVTLWMSVPPLESG
jgi:hypothetical protein